MSDKELMPEATEEVSVVEVSHEDSSKSDDSYRELALEHGWNPNGPKSAKDYILFALENLPKKNAALESQNKRIEDKDRKLQELEVVLNQLASDMSKQKELAYNQALNDLKAQRREAIALGDADMVDKLDNAQENLRKQQEEVAQSQEISKQQAMNQMLIDDFRDRNSTWVSGTSIDELEMQAYARQIEQACAAQGMQLQDCLSSIEKAVQKKYGSYFNDAAPVQLVEGAQESNNTMKKGQKTYTFRDLSDAQKMAAKYLADRGTMTIETYIKKAIETGDLK